MIHNDYTPTIAPRRSVLDRRFGIERITTELLLYGLLFAISIFLHIWQLDVKAMHHDESIHAWMSYKFFNGLGPFTCAGGGQSDTYCYDPVYHGPSLYVLTLLSYFLFGVGDAQSRLPMALAGIALVPMAWMLRPFVGRKAALLAAVLMTISPSILYYTRFARHDALVLLWSVFMVVGLFKFLREGGAVHLSLAAAGLALTWATHELVFILIFIGGSFFGFRLLWEWRPRLFFVATAIALALAVVFVGITIVVTEQQSPGLYKLLHRLLGPVLLLGGGALLILPMALAWEREPIVSERLADTWRFERGVYGAALATFLIIFTLLFSTFFAYPKGFLDGWYQGINYWLGSQHDFARGEQPWFYYLMLLPIYDLLALLFGLVGLGWLMAGCVGQRRAQRVDAAMAGETQATAGDGWADAPADPAADGPYQQRPISSLSRYTPPSLLVFFLGYWFIQAFIGFSWAGEKMPWLVTHISLPATLLAAWVLGTLIDRVPWRELRYDYGWTVPLLTFLLISSTFVAAYAFSGSSSTIDGLRARLQGLIPIVFAGLCMFGLLTIASWFGGRVVLRLAGLTVAAALLLYGIRASTFVVYRHPDTPVEPLIYTQTAPDVPILVRQIRQIAINQTRNQRTAQDPTGGLSMPLLIDGGGSKHSGEGSLAWPLQWYLRDFQSIRWFDPDTSTAINPDVPVLVLYKPHVTPDLRSQLEDEYVKTSEGVFNWWFPEHTDTGGQNDGQQTRGYKSLGAEGVGTVLSWPLKPSNWPALARYMLYRELPLDLKGREMEVYMRRDVAPGGGGGAVSSIPTETIKPDEVFAQSELNGARGMTADRNGNLYIADALNHRIVVLSPQGEQLRTIGSLGNGDGQLNEPSGVAVDDDGNVYVADTWNSRIVKFSADGTFIKHWGSSTTPFGDPFTDSQTGQTVQRFATDTKGEAEANKQHQLGFFGPRNVLVLDDRVYIADTGNSRIVVTDRDGQFLHQFGSKGSAAGQMQEPIGLGSDEQGLVYVGDTWNGRVQVFQRAADGTTDPTPVKTIEVKGWVANTYTDPYIAVAPDGRLWATLGGRNMVAAFDQSQQNPRRLKSDPALNAPKGLAFSPDNSVYVLSSGRNEILRFRQP